MATELANSFCRTDPAIAEHFARVTFLSDNREDLGLVNIPTLILQCSDDIIAPPAVGAFVHARMRHSVLVQMKATGHCPNLSAPDETIAAIESFLAGLSLMTERRRPGPDIADDPVQALYDAAPCALFSTLPDGEIVRANRTFVDWLGASPRTSSAASASRRC